MNENLKKYQEFIDDVVSIRESVPAKWIANGSYPDLDTNRKRNKVLSTLNEAQRNEISAIVQEAKESGIHDLLVLINQECTVKYKGAELPSEPFGTELNYDFVARSEGDEWPQ